jgi:hypothetical protein
MFRLSNKLFSMLSSFPKESERIFNRYKGVNNLRRTFERQRKRTAKKLGNPRMQKITFHKVIHWKALLQNQRYFHAIQVLGHKNIKNTLLYTQLLQVEKDNQFICKVAKTPKEIHELIEQTLSISVPRKTSSSLERESKLVAGLFQVNMMVQRARLIF